MGTGKSTVGRLLAERLGFGFVDTDAVIEERHGPIPEIFAAQGEAAFRSMEGALAVELAARSRLVISTGGGMVLDETVASTLAETGDIVCLVAAPETILERVLADESGPERPLLAHPDVSERVLELLAERAERYGRFRQVATDDRTPDEVATAVVAAVVPGR